MELSSIPSIKSIFQNEQKYNNINLYEASLFEHAIITYHELINYPEQEFTTQIKLILQFLNIYNKFDKYDFCQAYLNTGFQIDLEENQKTLLIKDANLTKLLTSFYDKLNLVISDFMEVVDYVPHRVSFNNKTSVFLIAYATDLKEFWEAFEKSNTLSIIDMNLEDKIFREEYFKEKLKFVPVAGAKGAWAKGPINLAKN